MKKTLKSVVIALAAIGVAGCHSVSKLPEKWGFPTTTGKDKNEAATHETKPTKPVGVYWLLLLVAMLGMFTSGCGTCLWDPVGHPTTTYVYTTETYEVPGEVYYYPGPVGTVWFGGGGSYRGSSYTYRQPHYWSNSRWNQGGNCAPQGGHNSGGGNNHGSGHGHH